MSEDAKGIAINIMGRDFRVAMPMGEEKSLAAAVDLVNRRMKEVQASGKVVGNERVAMLAALNIAHEYVSLRGLAEDRTPLKSGVEFQAMEGAIDDALSEQDRLL